MSVFPMDAILNILAYKKMSVMKFHLQLSERVRFGLTVCVLCALWYCVSSTSSVLNKMVLRNFPYPMTMALCSLVSIPLYSAPMLRFWNIPRRSLPIHYILKYILPISIGKAIAVCTGYLSLWKVPVSYAHTVKATMPLFAVICARVILNEKQTRKVYLSLIPIICGVLIATATELSFDAYGMIFALSSTFTYALLNSFVKRVLMETHIHPMALLSVNAQIAAVLFMPFWALNDGVKIFRTLTDKEPGAAGIWMGFWPLLATSGLLSFAQNLLAFTLIHRLTALSYAVANATKRITVISVSLLALRNPVTVGNCAGMLLAVCGVFVYSRAKQDQKETRHQVPQVMTHATLSDVGLASLTDSEPAANGVLPLQMRMDDAEAASVAHDPLLRRSELSPVPSLDDSGGGGPVLFEMGGPVAAVDSSKELLVRRSASHHNNNATLVHQV